MKGHFLMFFVGFMLIGSLKSQEFLVRWYRKGTDYIVNFIKTSLQDNLRNLKFKEEFSGRTKLLILTLTYSLNNLKIERVSRPNIQVSNVPNIGVRMSVDSLEIVVVGDWRISPGLSGKVSVSAVLSANALYKISSNVSVNPFLFVSECDSRIRRLDIRFTESIISKILNLFSNWLAGLQQDHLNTQICKALRKSGVSLERLLVLRDETSQGNGDLEIAGATSITDEHLEVKVKGYNSKCSGSAIPFPPSQNRMFAVGFKPQSFLTEFAEQGNLTYHVTKNSKFWAMFNKQANIDNGWLNVTCKEVGRCFGFLLPQVHRRYEGGSFEALLRAEPFYMHLSQETVFHVRVVGNVSLSVRDRFGNGPFKVADARIAHIGSFRLVIMNNERLQIVFNDVDSSLQLLSLRSNIGPIEINTIRYIINEAYARIISPILEGINYRRWIFTFTDVEKIRIINTKIITTKEHLFVLSDLEITDNMLFT